MADVYGNIGSEPVELNNAATEATLKALLQSVQTLNRSIVSGGGGGASGGATSSSSSSTSNLISTIIGAPFRLLGASVTLLINGFKLAIGAINSLTRTLTGAISGLMDWSNEMISNPSIAKFYGELANAAQKIPIFGEALGAVIGLFQKFMAFQEENLTAYRTMTTVGVNFGGSLTQIRSAANAAQLSIGDFSNLMTTNSKLFAKLGGNVNDGAVAFSKMSAGLLKSDAGMYLKDLGFTTQQMNQGMADYLNMTGGRSASEMKNTKAITESASAYMEQLDGLARLTGESRDQLAQELKKKAANAAFEAKMQTMSEDERKKAMAGMANALATGGEGAVDAFQAQVMGMAPTTKAGQQYSAMFGEAAEGVRKSADMVYDGTKGTADLNEQMIQTQNAQMRDGKKYGEQTLFALTTTGGALGQTAQQVQSNNNRLAQLSEADRRAAMKKQDLQKTEADEMIAAQEALRDLGNSIMNTLIPILTDLTGPLTRFALALIGPATKLTQVFSSWVKTVDLKKVGDMIGSFFTGAMDVFGTLNGMIDWNQVKTLVVDSLKFISTALIDIFTSVDWKGILGSMKQTFNDVWGTIKDLFQPVFARGSELLGQIGRDIGPVFNDLSDIAKLLFADISSIVKTVSSFLLPIIKPVVQGFADSFLPFWDATKTFISMIKSVLQGDWASAGEKFKKIFEDIQLIVTNLIEGFANYFKNIWDKVSGFFTTGTTDAGELPKAATGGVFAGPTSGYPVMLHGKEMVVPLESTTTKTPLSTSASPTPSTNTAMPDTMQTLNNASPESQIVTLNLHISALVRHTRELVEYSRKNLDATRALNRNLFPA
jgi:hypothetical protein